jgi:orotate phosphoribosyltransferase
LPGTPTAPRGAFAENALVLQWPKDAEALGRALGDKVRAWGSNSVLSPALGGLIIGQEVGRALDVRAIFAERVERTLALRRGFSLSSSDRVLVVEDVLTTGLSTRETIDAARQAGATVVGACAIVDRSAGKHGLDVPFAALLPMDLPTYQPEQCPLCAAGSPVTKPGSRNA